MVDYEGRIVMRLEQARWERGISVAELARRIGVDRKRLWRVLNGERVMRADELVRLCAELGVGLERFALISVAGRTGCFGMQRRGARHDSSG
ncbi:MULTISPECIES: helix-turn-helix domain-containing protein [Gordonibacter]|uniref:Helix-turn-helix transcriptional regulator n=1 Tax=Gordonibacter faecis TaxID=3047475 RepID=A0ABT7DKJ3_9ACTN|nr:MULTISPECIES: helix-turn-helix transcriptional regulator [unclassified Gordonibacter]MDJ1650050.1 helix-turn-helix transcriptional regulator [Gordonibacter sp. KGMB12511]